MEISSKVKSSMSHELAEFATTATAEAAPSAVRAKLKATLLHNLGVLRAGAPLALPAIALAKAKQGGAGSTLLHDGTRAVREHAVLANSAMMHARTQDDTHLSTFTHLGATSLPALIAVAEAVDASGSDFLTAMLVTYEVGAAVAVAASPGTTERGFRASSVFGSMGVSAGVSRLLGLSSEQARNAIGLAASFGGGTSQTWISGSNEWQHQVGVAGNQGICAAELAEVGVEAATDSLEGTSGYFRAFAGSPSPTSFNPKLLGTCWRMLEVTYKPFPICAINQMPVTVLLEMQKRFSVTGTEISSIDVHLSPSEARYPGTETHSPFSSTSAALMSAPFCLAAAALEGTITRRVVEDFMNPHVRQLESKIQVIADSSLNPGECVITIESERGRFSSKDINSPPPFDWDFEEVRARLRDFGPELSMEMSSFDAFAAYVRDLDKGTVRGLVESLTAP